MSDSPLKPGLQIDASDAYSPQKSLLSDKAILEHLRMGNIVIEPFNIDNLSTSSYDVTLGRYYYREVCTGMSACMPPRSPTPVLTFLASVLCLRQNTAEPGLGLYNPYSETMVCTHTHMQIAMQALASPCSNPSDTQPWLSRSPAMYAAGRCWWCSRMQHARPCFGVCV